MSIKPLDTRLCPYCAETIKVAAKVCRFCGRSLETGQIVDVRVLSGTMNSAIAEYIDKGWQVVSQSPTVVHLKKQKEWSLLLIGGGVILVIVGFLFPPLLVVGIALLLLSLVDHLIRPEKTLHVTLEQIQAGIAPSGEGGINLLLVGLALVAIVLCSLAYYAT